MGVESKLRNRSSDNGTRFAYDNGDRKLYDRDACPTGCDEYVWHAALMFQDRALSNGWKVEARPILYTEIYDRVLTDGDLAAILNVGDASLNARTCDTQGIPGVQPLKILEDIIDYYYDNYDSNRTPSINDFVMMFDDNKAAVMMKYESSYLKSNASRVLQVLPHAKPSRRTAEQDEIARIKFRPPVAEDDNWSRVRSFVAAHKEG